MNAPFVTVSTAQSCDRDQWDEFVYSSKRAEAYHQFGWKFVFEDVFGHECHYLIARGMGGKVVGVLPLVHLNSRVFGSFLVSVPCFNYCGILCASDDVFTALQSAAADIARNVGAGHVELRHRAETKSDLPFRDDKVSMQLSLPASHEELWSAFKPKLRAQIRRPQKEGAVCVEGGEELLDEFYSVFSRNMRDLGTPVYPRDLFAEMLNRFPDTTRIFVVRMNEMAVAAGVTVGYADTLEIPSASALREFNRASPNMLLYWTILQHAIREGYSTFDFGRTTKDSGTYRFKKQWRAEPKELAWHYILPGGGELPRISPDNPKYRFAVRLWQHLPVPIANFIGPRVVKYLP